jgi:hypothetical protein
VDLSEALRANLLSAPVLFFALGVVGALVRSDLRFPEPLYVGITVYLLAAIGLKGGVALAEAGLRAVWLPGLAAVALGAAIALWTYPILTVVGRLSTVDAAAIAGHYGSVSAVTFVAATVFLREVGEPWEGYATAFLALMESPAIVVGVLLGKLGGGGPGVGGLRTAFHEALFGRSVVLLVGTLVVGVLGGAPALESVAGLFVTPFPGVLALFLLELGTVAGRRLGDLRRLGPFLLAFGTVMPLAHGVVGVGLGKLVGLEVGGATLLGVLAASASYIAAPAAMRASLPDANPTLYLTAALVVTFPFNVTLGIPIYYAVTRWLW